MDIDVRASSYMLVSAVVGSAEMASLTISGGGTPMAQVDKVIAVCGPSPCGPGSRSYDQASYAYSLGYGETIDDGSSGFHTIQPYSTLLLPGETSNLPRLPTCDARLTETRPA